jgi:hypothetical protein
VTPSGISQEALIAQARLERDKTKVRLSICKQIHNDLKASMGLLARAKDSPPIDAMNLIAEALEMFMQTQAGQLELNIREMEAQAASLDKSLEQVDSKVHIARNLPPEPKGHKS